MKKNTLKRRAVENTSVTHKAGYETETLKEGKPLDHSIKHDSKKVAGLSVGLTLNMGDYESLRADVWLTDEVKDNETSEDAYRRIFEVIQKTLQDVVDVYKN